MRGWTRKRTALLALAAVLWAPSVTLSAGDDPPAPLQRYFPKSRFPALDGPLYVEARDADTPRDAWVLGVVVDGQARAFELNLLTRYEVVNDRIGDRPVAVVWCPLANSAAIYDRRVGDRTLEFEPSGMLMYGSIVFEDRETESYWPLLQERALYGPLEGRVLTRIPGAVKARFADWVAQHPDTLVWSLRGHQHLSPNPMAEYLASSEGFRGTSAEDPRLPTKEPVFGLLVGERAYAAATRDVEGGRVFDLPDGRSLFLYRPAGAALQDTTRAFVSTGGLEFQGASWVETGTGARFDPETGTFSPGPGPEPHEGFDTFWYVWSLHHPGTALLGR